MSPKARYRPVVWIRRVLLVALFLFLGIVAAMIINSRRGRTLPGDEAAVALGSGGEEIRTGQGFEHEVTEEGVRRFVISGDRWVSTRDEKITLEGIRLRFFREDGETTVRADQGIYQRETATAKLEGDVVITTSGGIEVRGEGFELRRGGHVVASTTSPVRFSYRDRFSGKSRELAAHMRRRWYQLAGNVEVSNLLGGAEATSLEARKVVYEEKEQLIVAEGDVVLRRGGDELRARRLAVTLDEEGRSMRFASARWEVSGSRASPAGAPGSVVRFRGERAALMFSEETGEPESARVDGGETERATLDLVDADGVVRRLTTPRLTASFTGGVLSRSEADKPVLLRDFLPFDEDNPLATGCAQSAVASFDAAGDLENLVLEGGVDLHRPGLQASGDRAEATPGGGELRLIGSPARVYGRKGDFDAPTIRYEPRTGSGSASDGVRAQLPGKGDFTLLATARAADEPIHLTSETAAWAGDGGFTFEGAVRAWQNENFLVADKLVGAQSGRSLTATGRVKTVIQETAKPASEASPDAAEPGPAASGPGAEPAVPVEVTSTKLVYDGARRILHYTGSPRVHQAGSALTCDDLEVFLAVDSKLEEMICDGNSRVENPNQGHTVTGDRAVYRPGEGSVVISGRPVILTDKAGGKIRGGVLLYDLETGTARVQTGVPAGEASAVSAPGAAAAGGAD